MNMFSYDDFVLPDESYVRVLELSAGAAESPIQCNLIVTTRDEAENTYEAISYVWGDKNDNIPIICSGKSMLITQSLNSALQVIRAQTNGQSRRLWADAICINQKSVKEKNLQVKRMGRVYEDARRVIVWLGPDKHSAAFECFERLRGWSRTADGQAELEEQHQKSDTRNFYRLKIPAVYDPKNWKEMGYLLQCPWFSRVWVVQEVSLAKKCDLWWGEQGLDIAILMEYACHVNGLNTNMSCVGGVDVSKALHDLQHCFRFIYRTYQTAESWKYSLPVISWHSTRHKKSGLFLDVLHAARALSASEPCDYIYAFLANPLALNDGSLILEPDYGKGEEQLYFDAAKAFLSHERECRYLLNFVRNDPNEDNLEREPPSWIPQWRGSERDPSLSIGNIGVANNSGGDVQLLRATVHESVRGKEQLALWGVLFDRLTWNSKPLNQSDFAFSRTSWDDEMETPAEIYIQNLWDEVSKEYQRLNYTNSLDPDRYVNDFSITLVTGYNCADFKNFRSHRKIFRAYLKGFEGKHLRGKERENAERYEEQTGICSHRQLALTESGRFALVPQGAIAGDTCCIFFGMTTPFILRPMRGSTRSRNSFRLVGEAYLHDVMQGRLVRDVEEGHAAEEEIVLV